MCVCVLHVVLGCGTTQGAGGAGSMHGVPGAGGRPLPSPSVQGAPTFTSATTVANQVKPSSYVETCSLGLLTLLLVCWALGQPGMIPIKPKVPYGRQTIQCICPCRPCMRLLCHCTLVSANFFMLSKRPLVKASVYVCALVRVILPLLLAC